MSTLKAIQAILTNELKIETNINLEDYFKGYKFLEFIYFNSKIDLDQYYETCVLISMHSSNSQSVINKMPYYVFNNWMIYYNKIIERQNGDSGQEEEKVNKIQQDAKQNFRNIKTPKIKHPKIK